MTGISGVVTGTNVVKWYLFLRSQRLLPWRYANCLAPNCPRLSQQQRDVRC
jgi:hypothetical protein